MKQISYILIILIFFSCIKENKTLLSVDVTQDIVVPKHYIVTKTNETFKIDGIADELSWKSALFTDSFIDIEGVKTPRFDTKIKMLWDDDYLYVYSKIQEPHIWGNLKQRDTIIFYNNNFEVFLDPSGKGKIYGEIEINALNTVWDLLLDKPYRVGGKANSKWNLKNLKSNIHIQGSLNNPNDIDSFWTVEMAIPLKPLVELKNNPQTFPKEGEQWRINFSRVEWNHEIINGKYQRKKKNNMYLKENNWVWSNQKVINMHEPEKWGFLQFTDAKSSENITFIKDKDLQIKQAIYALFRKTKFYDLKYLLENKKNFSQDIEVTYSNEKPLIMTFYKTKSGFEYILKSSASKETYIINEEGILNQ